jgi:hypothetical protein
MIHSIIYFFIYLYYILILYTFTINMNKLTFREFFICIRFIIIFNLLFTVILYSWATENDLHNLPKSNYDRFMSIFYFLITTFTTTGYGDIYAKSMRMKLFISCYMIIVFSLSSSFLFDI